MAKFSEDYYSPICFFCFLNVFITLLVVGCFRQFDYDYTITYRTKEGKKRAALIAFRPGYLLGGVKGHERFYRELQVWLGDVLRPIGPSIKLVD